MITVLGATGQVGGELTRRLLRRGQKVRALGRSQEKLAALQALGAQIAPGDASDVEYLDNAFDGADAAFILMPHDVTSKDYHADQDLIGGAIVRALGDSAVTHIVFLSSMGADLASGTGVISSLYRQEERLRQLARNLCCVRPGSFYQNWLASMPVIREHGVIADAVGPEVSVPIISTQDIAAVAMDRLMDRNWKGTHVFELTGPRNLTYDEMTRLLGAAIGKPDLPYQQLSYEEMASTFVAAGFSRNVAREYVGLSQALNESRIKSISHVEHVIGRTSFESFAQEFAELYRQSSVP